MCSDHSPEKKGRSPGGPAGCLHPTMACCLHDNSHDAVVSLLVSGPCPPAAEALQAHNTVFQEHAAPSSPGSAPSTRGFRRASEISIASQVSGMAESYTASGIAQSEYSSATHPSEPGGSVLLWPVSTGPIMPPQRTVGDYWGGCHWHLVGRDLLNTL